jgi:hypothetical protein
MKALLVSLLSLCLLALVHGQTIPSSGTATATNYQVTSQGACNCNYGIANYPTAALSQYYFGAGPGQGSGPACGLCFYLQVYGDPYSSWCTSSGPSLVVKIADLCPGADNPTWCNGSPGSPNAYGKVVHFDLNSAYVGGLVSGSGGRGAWFVNYCEVPCSTWAGYNDGNANGQATSSWGYCPQDNPAQQTGNCGFASSCGGGGGGSYTVSWNGGTNAWWLGASFSPSPSSTPYVNCGNGQGSQPMSQASWDANTWIFPPSGSPCQQTVTFTIGGSNFSSTW